MTSIVQKLRALDDGQSRPVSMMEREVCGAAADAIDALTHALEHCLREHGGFTIRGESEKRARAALAMVTRTDWAPHKSEVW